MRYDFCQLNSIGLLVFCFFITAQPFAVVRREQLPLGEPGTSVEEEEDHLEDKSPQTPEELSCTDEAKAARGDPGPEDAVFTLQDLHRQRCNIFPSGHVQGASFKWFQFLLNRTGSGNTNRSLVSGLSHRAFQDLNQGYCPISGLPIGGKRNARVTLNNAFGGGVTTGIFYYSIVECICDLKDLVLVDKLNVTFPEGTFEQHVLVIGDPCKYPEEFTKNFLSAEAQGETSLNVSAPEVKCNADGRLAGAVKTAHGFPVIGLFFNFADHTPEIPPQDGDSEAMSAQCTTRASEGFLTGNAPLFRRIAQINPINGPKMIS